MVWTDESETCEGPNELNSHNVMYYSHHAREVKGTLRTKAQKFLDLGLIEWNTEEKCFYVNPIEGYNTRTYEIRKRDKGFECNCQACQTKMKKEDYDPNVDSSAPCSHILAVYLWLKIKNYKAADNEEPINPRD